MVAFLIGHSGGRFVEQYEGRIYYQRPGDTNAPFIRVGQRVRVCVRLVTKSDPFENVHRVVVRPLSVQSETCCRRFHVFAHQQFTKKAAALKSARYPSTSDLVWRPAGNIRVSQVDTSGGR